MFVITVTGISHRRLPGRGGFGDGYPRMSKRQLGKWERRDLVHDKNISEGALSL